MSTAELTATITEYQEIKRMIEELTAEMETLSDTIKSHMGDSESLIAGPYKVTYSTVTTNRLDTTALKKAHPEIASEFTKTVVSRRFSVK